MGFYIQTPEGNKNKAANIHNAWGGRIVGDDDDLPSFQELEEKDEVLIVVCDNGMFEAAAICYSESEYDCFLSLDGRPKTFVVLDKTVALKAFAEECRIGDEVERLRKYLDKNE